MAQSRNPIPLMERAHRALDFGVQAGWHTPAWQIMERCWRLFSSEWLSPHALGQQRMG